jgi:hypothetical protein
MRDEAEAWQELRCVMKKAENMQVVHRRFKGCITDAEILAAARDCNHRPDGVRCRACREIVDKCEGWIQEAADLESRYKEEFGEKSFKKHKRRSEVSDAIVNGRISFLYSDERHGVCHSGDNGGSCDECEKTLQREREYQQTVAELKRQYELEFREAYGSWHRLPEKDEQTRYYTFWDFAKGNRHLWEDPDSEKEYEKCRKLWVDEWKVGKRRHAHLKDDKHPFEDFWCCWEWNKNRDKYTMQYKSQEPASSEFWDVFIKTEQPEASDNEGMDVEECANGSQIEEVQKKMDALDTADDVYAIQ